MQTWPHSTPFLNPLVTALDVDTAEEALKLVSDLKGLVGGFKVGPRLCLRYGQDFIREVAKAGPVFMDNKHFDIPSTMDAAIRSSFEAGASVVTVHALAGHKALEKMAALEKELSAQRPFRILAVTVLTSWDQESLPLILKPDSLANHVVGLAKVVKKSGLRGLVCSAHEIHILADQGFYLLTPGIRFPDDDAQDQKRVATPQEALQAGAQALVVGRPIIYAAHPRQAAERFLAAFEESGR